LPNNKVINAIRTAKPKITIPELNTINFSLDLSFILYSVAYLDVDVEIPKSPNIIKKNIMANI